MTEIAIQRGGGIDDLHAERDGGDQTRHVLPVKHIQSRKTHARQRGNELLLSCQRAGGCGWDSVNRVTLNKLGNGRFTKISIISDKMGTMLSVRRKS